jgi:hypothetical protein
LPVDNGWEMESPHAEREVWNEEEGEG